jgi:hypothetical protein
VMSGSTLKWRLVIWPKRIMRVLIVALISLAVFAAVKATSTCYENESGKVQKEMIEKQRRW